MTVLIQAGHQNIEQNCNWGLRGQTGANGERAYVSEIAAIVCGALAANGVAVQGIDANANCNGQITGRDWEAVVALHCDGRSASGFAVGVGNPTTDGAKEASASLAAALRSAYATATALNDLSSEYVNDENITEYYLFNALSQATPFALVELGAIAGTSGGFGPDQLYLAMHQHDVASGIVNGVLQFLGKGPLGATGAVIPAAPSVDTTPTVTPSESASGPLPVDAVPLDPPASLYTPGPPPSTSQGNIPEVAVPPLVGPPPALVPDVKSVAASALLALEQARDFLTQLQGML